MSHFNRSDRMSSLTCSVCVILLAQQYITFRQCLCYITSLVVHYIQIVFVLYYQPSSTLHLDSVCGILLAQQYITSRWCLWYFLAQQYITFRQYLCYITSLVVHYIQIVLVLYYQPSSTLHLDSVCGILLAQQYITFRQCLCYITSLVVHYIQIVSVLYY